MPFQVTTTDDPIIRELSKTSTGNVFATDAILATLMTASRSVYSWDIIADVVSSRNGPTIFFDKRENSDFDLLTVNETAYVIPAPLGADAPCFATRLR